MIVYNPFLLSLEYKTKNLHMNLNTTTSKKAKATKSMRTRLLIPFCSVLLMVFTFSRCCLMANGEFYSSVESLKILANMEATLTQNFRQHLKLQKQDIDSVRRFIKDVKLKHELAKVDVNDYIGNPINAFTLIKRLVNDWNDLFKLVKFPDIKIGFEELSTQFGKEIQPPDDNELKGTIRGLRRLQTIYNLNVDEMAKGEKYGKQPDWHDCFEIGTTLLDDSSFNLAIDWLKQSHLKLQESKETNGIKSTFTTHIREYLALAYQAIGESKTAVEHLDAVLENDSESSVKLTKNFLLKIKTNISLANNLKRMYRHAHARLCRGESLTNKQQLNCKLDSKLHPFFILSPVQVEPLLLNPQITLYHNVINDDQISKLLRVCNKNMKRSEVSVGGKRSVYAESRVSQQTWVHPEKSTIANFMFRVVSAITGLDLENAEILQVANYGIGGEYYMHCDFFGYEHVKGFEGDRISTNMFYLSDVEEGGFTVFPILDVYVKPVKGSMVMWYNLHRSLKGDYRTVHAGCPVLKGNKKIANIWTHSGYQEFRRPCGLENEKRYYNIYM